MMCASPVETSSIGKAASKSASSSPRTGASREAAADIYRNRPDKEEDKPALAEDQCGWLREIGYRDVDCFFKVFAIAIFGGRK